MERRAGTTSLRCAIGLYSSSAQTMAVEVCQLHLPAGECDSVCLASACLPQQKATSFNLLFMSSVPSWRRILLASYAWHLNVRSSPRFSSLCSPLPASRSIPEAQNPYMSTSMPGVRFSCHQCRLCMSGRSRPPRCREQSRRPLGLARLGADRCVPGANSPRK